MVRRPARAWLGAFTLLLAGRAPAQIPTPVADRVETPRLPSGISEQPVKLNGRLAYLFQDEEKSDVVYLVGEVAITLGAPPARTLHSREAVVWITRADWDGRPYRQLQVYLWRDAEVLDAGNTLAAGPALFVTMNTFADVTTEVDDYAIQPAAESPVYVEGNAIRQALRRALPSDPDAAVAARVLDASGLPAGDSRPEPKPAIVFQTNGEFVLSEYDGRPIVTVVGGAYLSRGVPGSADFVEIQADSVAVFLSPGAASLTAMANLRSANQRSKVAAGDGEPPRPGVQRMSAAFGDVDIDAVYLEGDVRMSQGPTSIRSSRLYYEPAADRALILDAVVRTVLVSRAVPLYLRAEEIRQLSANRYSATDAVFTTSEFHTPHYHIGAERVELTNLTPQGDRGVTAGSFSIQGATFNVGGHPITYWPAITGTVDTSEAAIRGLRLGYSDDFGAEFETDWHLFNVLNLETPEGYDATLRLNYYTERGPGIGVDADYQRDNYYGLIRSYALSDDGVDSLGRERETFDPREYRGRALIRHRQFLEDDWQLTLEGSYISDRSFLEEYFEREFDNDKDQETLLHLKKQRDNWAFTSLLQWRPLDFTTQTERFPDFGFYLVGESLSRRVNLYSESHAGFVRYRPADQTLRELLRDGGRDSSGATGRADTRQELTSPFDLGSVRLVPFVAGRASAWDDSIDSGGMTRGFGAYGVRGSTYLSRVYPDVRSELFDVTGVRHIIKPDVTAWASHTNVDSDRLFPFDDTVETIDEIDGVSLGLRQRWQTKRGPAEKQRSVDLFTFDLEAGFFNDDPGDAETNGYTSFSRPENSIARNYISSSAIWRVNDRTAVLNEVNYDVTDGTVGIMNLSLAVERTPRFSYLVGYRYIGKTESNVLGLDLNYRLTDKHTVAVREQFDLDRGRTLDFTIALIRRHPRWFSAVAFELDEAEDDVGVSLSVWPEGLPQAAIGSKRFTGLANTTSVQSY